MIEIQYLPHYVTPELKYQTNGSVGLDLKSCLERDYELEPGHRLNKIPSGIKLNMSNSDYFAMIFARSGLGTNGIILSNGTGIIDKDYQGEISISLWNTSNDKIVIGRGDRIAQLVFMKAYQPETIIVTNFINITKRGESGFGSTGVK